MSGALYGVRGAMCDVCGYDDGAGRGRGRNNGHHVGPFLGQQILVAWKDRPEKETPNSSKLIQT